MNISSIFYFLKLTSKNTHYSGLLDTFFTKDTENKNNLTESAKKFGISNTNLSLKQSLFVQMLKNKKLSLS